MAVIHCQPVNGGSPSFLLQVVYDQRLFAGDVGATMDMSVIEKYSQVKLGWHEYSRANAEDLAQFTCQGCADFSFTCQDCRQVALWHNG